VIDRVRRFNRLVTQRVGALDDHYLSRDRPLGEARMLWEIGVEGRDVRELRRRLDLDSGYAARLLRALEADKLVTVEPSPHDRRVRIARLTGKGRAERVVLDERGDALVRSMLEPLRPTDQQRLVDAMAEVERLLTASLVRIDVVDPAHRDAQRCLRAYFAEIDRRFDDGFDEATSRPATPEHFRLPAGVFLVATLWGEPVGCGGLKLPPRHPAEIKRMWVAETARGLGIGRRLLSSLENEARARGKRRIRLDTNRNLREAIAMYRAAGYAEVAPFNDEPYAHHWFEKRLRRPQT
jgi:DNA-binding MarR family transcriptional regulator/GNAT superfamily N-acetyltransferase